MGPARSLESARPPVQRSNVVGIGGVASRHAKIRRCPLEGRAMAPRGRQNQLLRGVRSCAAGQVFVPRGQL